FETAGAGGVPLAQEQPHLGDDTAVGGKAAEAPGRRENAVTGNDEREGVLGHRLPHRARRARGADARGELAVGGGAAGGDGANRLVDPAVEGGHAVEVEWDL